MPVQNNVFRCSFYPITYSGFSGQVLTPGLPIELNPLPYVCNLSTGNFTFTLSRKEGVSLYPNPAKDFIEIIFHEKNYTAEIINPVGEKIFREKNISRINLEKFESGIYLLLLTSASSDRSVEKFAVMR